MIICMKICYWQNFSSRAVLEALSSCLVNKYSEGYPGARYDVFHSNFVTYINFFANFKLYQQCC